MALIQPSIVYRPSSQRTRGAREIVDWYEADPARQVVDARFDALSDRLIAACEAAMAHG